MKGVALGGDLNVKLTKEFPFLFIKREGNPYKPRGFTHPFNKE
jgi:hypothetical protein